MNEFPLTLLSEIRTLIIHNLMKRAAGVGNAEDAALTTFIYEVIHLRKGNRYFVDPFLKVEWGAFGRFVIAVE